MEKYIPILIVAVTLVLKLFFPNKKRQPQDTAENFPELPGLPDLFPDLVTAPEVEKQEEMKMTPAFESLGAVPLVEGGRDTGSERMLEQMRTVTSDKIPKEAQKRIEILDDFDIRKAIIYHEILQPKYLE
jgi:hypothetical protein